MCLFACLKMLPLWVKVTENIQRFIADLSSIINLVILIHTSQKFRKILASYVANVAGVASSVTSKIFRTSRVERVSVGDGVGDGDGVGVDVGVDDDKCENERL